MDHVQGCILKPQNTFEVAHFRTNTLREVFTQPNVRLRRLSQLTKLLQKGLFTLVNNALIDIKLNELKTSNSKTFLNVLCSGVHIITSIHFGMGSPSQLKPRGIQPHIKWATNLSDEQLSPNTLREVFTQPNVRLRRLSQLTRLLMQGFFSLEL